MWAAVVLILGQIVTPASGSAVSAHYRCRCIPSTAATAAAFDLAGASRLGPHYPHLPRIGVDSAIVPPAILKAMGWVESDWNQFDRRNRPLLSGDFGYGLMQITTGMAGAFGQPQGTLPLSVQGPIGGDYRYNVAYAARMLAENLLAAPAIDHRDPTVLEDWYYAIWAYNGWGWVNNPNNPAFTRSGTPASDPSSFPYQERVFYWVQHPPKDASGHPLWTPMHVSLPARSQIGDAPHALTIRHPHRDIPQTYGATYQLGPGPTTMAADSGVTVHVRAYNVGGLPWAKTGNQSVGLGYHWVERGHRGGANYDPHLKGIDVADGNVAKVGSPVPVGGSWTFKARIKAPNVEGTLRLEWDMKGRSVGWFSHVGGSPGVQSVRLLSAGADVPAYHEPSNPPLLRGVHAWKVALTSAPLPSVLTRGQAFSETILVFNPGGRAWGPRFRIAELGTGETSPLPLTRVPSCRTLPLTISGVAGQRVGRETYRWRLETGSGLYFGPTFTVGFQVHKRAISSSPSGGIGSFRHLI